MSAESIIFKRFTNELSDNKVVDPASLQNLMLGRSVSMTVDGKSKDAVPGQWRL